MALRVRPRAPQDENAAMPHLSGSKSVLISCFWKLLHLIRVMCCVGVFLCDYVVLSYAC